MLVGALWIAIVPPSVHLRLFLLLLLFVKKVGSSMNTIYWKEESIHQTYLFCFISDIERLVLLLVLYPLLNLGEDSTWLITILNIVHETILAMIRVPWKICYSPIRRCVISSIKEYPITRSTEHLHAL